MRNIRFILLVLSTFLVVDGASAARSKKLVQPVAFETIDDAAVAALRIAVPVSRAYEYGGCIYKFEGHYYYTTPVTDRMKDSFIAACEITRDSFVAIYHTHPAGGQIGFSSGDIGIAQQLKVFSYIAILDRGYEKIVRYTPNQTILTCRLDELRNDESAVCADGDLVTRTIR